MNVAKERCIYHLEWRIILVLNGSYIFNTLQLLQFIRLYSFVFVSASITLGFRLLLLLLLMVIQTSKAKSVNRIQIHLRFA